MNIADTDRGSEARLANCQHVFDGFREGLLLAVYPVQQDRVRYKSETFNAGLGRTHQVVIRTVAAPLVFAIGSNVEGDTNLRHDDDRIATTLPGANGLTDEALVVAELGCVRCVDIRGVDEGDALGKRVMEHRNRVIPWHQFTSRAKRFGKQHRTDADRGNGLIGELGE